MVWAGGDGRLITAFHAPDGTLAALTDDEGRPTDPIALPPQGRDRLDALFAFEKAALDRNGLGDFSYNPTTYRPEEGRQGAIVVRVKSTGRIGNAPGVPAIVPPQGAEDPIHLINGSLVAP